MDTVVYSANIANYDLTSDPPYKDPNIRYILFTDDRSRKSDYWEINHVESYGDPTRLARYIKLQPHNVLPEHKTSVWVDSSLSQVKSITGLLSGCVGLSAYPHTSYMNSEPNRVCLYKEAEVCMQRGLDDSAVISNQIDQYRKEGFPQNMGLFATGLLIRLNNEQVNIFNDLWWEELKSGSKRDQISQMYCAWKTGITTTHIKGSIYHSPYFKKRRHLKSK